MSGRETSLDPKRKRTLISRWYTGQECEISIENTVVIVSCWRQSKRGKRGDNTGCFEESRCLLWHFECRGVKRNHCLLEFMSNKRDEITVVFRLGAPYPDKVREKARALNISENQFARLALVQHLENSDLLNLQDEIREVREEVRQFRSEFEAVVVEERDEPTEQHSV